jgi:hypothetical protein
MVGTFNLGPEMVIEHIRNFTAENGDLLEV